MDKQPEEMTPLEQLKWIDKCVDSIRAENQDLRTKITTLSKERDVYAEIVRNVAVDGLGLTDPWDEHSPTQPSDWTGLLSQKVADLRAKLTAAHEQYTRFRDRYDNASIALIRADARLATSEADVRRLTRFAAKVIDGHTGTWDGCEIEEMAIEAGLMTAVEVTEPCCEGCACASVDNIPGTCYRPTESIRAALKERDAEAQG